MDRRKSSLALGSRTRKNILKGKFIRKQNDGTDIYADYWTDDDGSSNSASERNSDHLQHQITVSNRNVTSPLKSDEHNVKNWDTDINRSPTKKQNLSQNVHHYATRSMINKLNISSGRNDINEEHDERSSNFQHLFSKANTTGRHIKKAAVPSLSEKNVNEKMTLKNVTAESISSSESNDSLSSSFISISQCAASNKTFTLPLKSVKCNVKSCDRNVDKSPNKKENLPQNVNHSYATEIMSNKSNISSSGKDINEEYDKQSSSFLHLSSKANVTGRHTKNTAVSPISTSVKVKKGIQAVETVTPKNVLISKSINEDEIEANKSSNISQHTRSNRNITSPLCSVENNIEGHHKNIDQSPAKKQKLSPKIQQDIHYSAGNVGKKSNISSSVKSINEEDSESSSISQNKTSNASTTSKYTENATSSFGRSRKMEKMLAMQNNVPDNNHNTSDIRILRTKKKHRTEVIHSTSSSNIGESDGNVVHPFPEKTSNERNNSVELREEQVSEYDELDKKIMQMVDKSEKMKANTSETNSRNEIPSHGKKCRTPKFASKRKSTRTSNSSSKKHVSRHKSHNRPYSVLKASETFKATNKNATETDEFDDEAASDFDNYREAPVNMDNETFSKATDMSVTESDESDEEVASDFDNYRKAEVNKNNETLSKAAHKNVTETDEPGEEAASDFDNYRKTRVNKNNETLSKAAHKNVTETDEPGQEAALGLDNCRKAQRDKTRENIDALASSSKYTAQIPEVDNLPIPNLKRKGGKKEKYVNKNNENICVSNDQVQLSKGKKGRKKKTIDNSNDASGRAVRRSARQKFPPLASWRNERPLYRTEKGIIEFVGIDKGLREDDGAIKQLVKAQNKAGKHDKKEKTCAKFKLDDIIQKKKVNLIVMKKFDHVPWEKIILNNKYPYGIKKLFETDNSAFGFIEIEKEEEKPLQYMPSDDVYLSVMRGKIQLTIQDNTCTVEEKDMVVVPRCMPYSLKNIGRTSALLVFCIGRFQYVENGE